MKVLIVEDNQDLAHNIRTYLHEEGYVCEQADGYHAALSKLGGFNYDLIILDLMLPDGNGLDILEWVKKTLADTGVLILSAKNALDDKIKGLEMGADDYLAKPFHLTELNARLKAIYRRRQLQGHSTLKVHNLEINTETMEVRVEEALLDLTKKEYELLMYFIVNQAIYCGASMGRLH